MADVKISDLTAKAADLATTDTLEINESGTSKSVTGADIFGGAASATETLTNKSFNANGTGNSLSNVDVADLANGTDGELITWDSAGVAAIVAVGTAGQALTSNGAGSAPTFQAGGSAQATQAAIEAETNEDTYVPPDLVKNSPGVAKVWASVNRSAGTPVLNSPSYNVTSVTDDGAANTIITIATDFSDADYAVGAASRNTGGNRTAVPHTIVVGAFDVIVEDLAGGSRDTEDFSCWAFGDQ